MIHRTLIVGLALIVLGMVPARADHPLTTAQVATVGLTFVPGDENRPTVPLEVVRYGSLRFTNADIDLHTLTSYATVMGEPLFDSGPVPPGGTVMVPGVGAIEPGEYRFFCAIHTPMRGRLRVLARAILTPR